LLNQEISRQKPALALKYWILWQDELQQMLPLRLLRDLETLELSNTSGYMEEPITILDDLPGSWLLPKLTRLCLSISAGVTFPPAMSSTTGLQYLSLRIVGASDLLHRAEQCFAALPGLTRLFLQIDRGNFKRSDEASFIAGGEFLQEQCKLATQRYSKEKLEWTITWSRREWEDSRPEFSFDPSEGEGWSDEG